MGYFSNVRICLLKKNFKELKKKLKDMKSNILDVCDVSNKSFEIGGRDYILLGWNKIEWYLHYKDVFCIEQTLKRYKASNIPFIFIRVGQGMNDFQLDSCITSDYNFNCMEVMKSINVCV